MSCETHRRRDSGHAALRSARAWAGSPIPQALDDPSGVVAGDELSDDPPRLLHTLEPVKVNALLFQSADEAFHDPIGQSNRLHTFQTIQSEAFGSPIRFTP
jgi:hypothetical protein